jgi:hypothetical protein
LISYEFNIKAALAMGAATLLLGAAGCGGASPGGKMKLADEGYVKISGGCECYTEGLITFRPAFGDAVKVEVDNSGAWFYEDNEPVESFKVKIDADDAADFFEELKDVLDNAVGTETCSTRAAVIEIYLPFRDGTVETTWRELDVKQDVNPLLELLQEFVEECGEEA